MNSRLLWQLTSPRWVPSDSASWRASNQLTPGGPTSQTAQVEAPATTPQCQQEVVMGKIMSFIIMFYYQQKVWDVRSQSWDKRLNNWAAHYCTKVDLGHQPPSVNFTSAGAGLPFPQLSSLYNATILAFWLLYLFSFFPTLFPSPPVSS